MSLGLFGDLEVLPALAVPCGLASVASFVCVFIVVSFIANLHGREGSGMLSFGLGGSRLGPLKSPFSPPDYFSCICSIF